MPVDIITHSVGPDAKGSALTVLEMDNNLINLNNTLNEIEAIVDTFESDASSNYEPLLWTRPSDYLELDEFDTSLEKIQMLLAIYDTGSTTGNAIAFNLEITNGYKVDWGDGTTHENFNSGITAEHYYDYNNANLVGTETNDGFRQVIITITPQDLTKKFSKFGGSWGNLFVAHSKNINWYYPVISLNISCNGPIAAYGASVQTMVSLKEIRISLPNMTNTYWDDLSLLIDCVSLQNINYIDVSSVTSAYYMMYGCDSLMYMPTLNIPNAQNLEYLFSSWQIRKVENVICPNADRLDWACSGSYKLKYAKFETSEKATTMWGMFNGCEALEKVPYMITSNVTNMRSLYFQCYFNLKEVPQLDTSSVIYADYMHALNYQLESIPEYNFTNALYRFDYALQQCWKIKEVPVFDVTNVTYSTSGLNGTLRNCYSLRTAPDWNLSNVTDSYGMFASCSTLVSAPTYDLSLNNDGGMIFYQGCDSLLEIPAFDLSASTQANFQNMYALQRSRVTGLSVSHTYINCNLSATALDEIFTNLPIVTGKTITVTNNPGSATCTPSIAQAKGWTVVGAG